MINLRKGTVNFNPPETDVIKMESIQRRIQDAPLLTDDNEIHKLFTSFYDEIDDMVENGYGDSIILTELRDTQVIPMLTCPTTIAEYKQRAYDEREQEFYDMKREEEAEREYAAEHDMDHIYWCDACMIGICEEIH